MKVSRDSKNSIIDIKTGNKKYNLKFSHLEEINLNKVLAKWLPGSLSPFVALISALLYLATEDNELSVEENDFIVKIAQDQALLETANTFYQSQPVEALFKILEKLDEEQKYCIMANLFELAMCGGILHSNELKLIKKFGKSMNMAPDEYETIKQVMVMKNKLGILKK